MSEMKASAYLVFFFVLLMLAKSKETAFAEVFKAFVLKPVCFIKPVFASSNK